MDARKYFQGVVVPAYDSFAQGPPEFHLFANTILSMSAAADHLGLYQRGYDPGLSGNQPRRDVRKIRYDLGLAGLQACADALKHGRQGEASRCPPLALIPLTEVRGTSARTAFWRLLIAPSPRSTTLQN
jgi:hypothetical protein